MLSLHIHIIFICFMLHFVHKLVLIIMFIFYSYLVGNGMDIYDELHDRGKILSPTLFFYFN